MATYIHQTPGRIRIQLTELKSNDRLASTLHNHLRKVPGMQRVSANSITGSLRLYYEEDTVRGWEILSILRKAGLLGNLVPFPSSNNINAQRVAPAKIPKLCLSPETKKILLQLATIAVTALLERGVSKIAAGTLKRAL